jgi:hypothetical protein
MWRRDIESNLMSMTEMLQSALPVMATSPVATTHETTPECGTRLKAAGQMSWVQVGTSKGKTKEVQMYQMTLSHREKNSHWRWEKR